MNPVSPIPATAVRRISQQPGERRRDASAGDEFRRALQDKAEEQDGQPDGQPGGGTPARHRGTVPPVSPVSAALQRQQARSRREQGRTDDGTPLRHIDVLA